MSTNVNDNNTGSPLGVTRGRGVGLVAFLFGMSGRERLAGTTVRRMLADVGVSDDAARALLARMVRTELLTSDREGRTTSYALAGAFAAGVERVRRQAMTVPTPWPGHFHALLHAVPEEHRAYRDQLRRAAVLAGYGVLQPGVLIALTDRSHALADQLREIPVGAAVRRTTLGMSLPDAVGAASTAWDLPQVAEVFRGHIARLDGAPVIGGSGALRAYAELLQPALSDTLREPALDPALLPDDWPGPELRAAFSRFNARHGSLVADYLGEVLEPGR